MIRSALNEIPVFEKLDRVQIDELNEWLTRKEFSPGALIIKDGDATDGIYVLAKGTVEVVKGAGFELVVLAELESPSVVGETGLLSGQQRSASIRAKTPVIAGFLPGELFEKKLSEDNITALRIALNLGRITAARLRVATKSLAELTEATRDYSGHF
ncbi:MAG TPA: cyclic nucleotide-binding domain-containing protein [Planctomycetota bacterium]|jgi:CRP-like cAMP-binding protein